MIATAETTATLKRCPKCGDSKPAEPGYFHRAGDKGLSCWCVPCIRDYRRGKAATADYQEARRNYRTRPEVREAKRDYDRERRARASKDAARRAARGAAAVRRRGARPDGAVPCDACGTTGGTVRRGAKNPTRWPLRGVGRVCLECLHSDTVRRRREAAAAPPRSARLRLDPAVVAQVRREWFGLVGPRPWRRTLDDLTGADFSRALVAAFDRRRPSDLRAILGPAAFAPEAGKGARCTA